MVVGPGIKTGLNIQMDNPASVGSDLIVAAVAALQEYTAPLMLIDMGTATTITVVDQGNNYIGGAIIPGVRVSAEALSSRAAQLPGIQLDRPKRAIGKNTIECMRSGIMYGAAAMLGWHGGAHGGRAGQAGHCGGHRRYCAVYCAFVQAGDDH